jgi:hypothetical protein
VSISSPIAGYNRLHDLSYSTLNQRNNTGPFSGDIQHNIDTWESLKAVSLIDTNRDESPNEMENRLPNDVPVPAGWEYDATHGTEDNRTVTSRSNFQNCSIIVSDLRYLT